VGKYLLKKFKALKSGSDDPKMRHFKYKHAGNLATIGRHRAVVDFGFFNLKGWLAWFFWGFIHILFLIQARSAIIVGTQWLWSYISNRKPARLIVDGDEKS